MATTKIEWCDKVKERFWANVNKSGDCWIWMVGKFANGYGQFRVGPQKVKAHRFAWEITNGPIPSNYFICHKCDNPSCVNPNHLFLGTPKDNSHDRDSKGRSARGPNPNKGSLMEQNPSAKLNREQVIQIRILHFQNGLSYRKLAKQFGVTMGQIGHILQNRVWRYPECQIPK